MGPPLHWAPKEPNEKSPECTQRHNTFACPLSFCLRSSLLSSSWSSSPLSSLSPSRVQIETLFAYRLTGEAGAWRQPAPAPKLKETFQWWRFQQMDSLDANDDYNEHGHDHHHQEDDMAAEGIKSNLAINHRVAATAGSLLRRPLTCVGRHLPRAPRHSGLASGGAPIVAALEGPATLPT